MSSVSPAFFVASKVGAPDVAPAAAVTRKPIPAPQELASTPLRVTAGKKGCGAGRRRSGRHRHRSCRPAPPPGTATTGSNRGWRPRWCLASRLRRAAAGEHRRVFRKASIIGGADIERHACRLSGRVWLSGRPRDDHTEAIALAPGARLDAVPRYRRKEALFVGSTTICPPAAPIAPACSAARHSDD